MAWVMNNIWQPATWLPIGLLSHRINRGLISMYRIQVIRTLHQKWILEYFNFTITVNGLINFRITSHFYDSGLQGLTGLPKSIYWLQQILVNAFWAFICCSIYWLQAINAQKAFIGCSKAGALELTKCAMHSDDSARNSKRVSGLSLAVPDWHMWNLMPTSGQLVLSQHES